MGLTLFGELQALSAASAETLEWTGTISLLYTT